MAGAAPDTVFAFMGDEHGALVAPDIGGRLRPGDAVTMIVPHCDPTVNLYDNYHVVQGDKLVDIWPVSARGRAR
jgi:D-serine deaminase-like pyridoxal phosphate-dependent protein